LSAGREAGCNGVYTGPGQTAFTRMCFGASCIANDLVKVMMAPLVAE
jgi:hypothetical protein